jgi:hypothetical protein
LCSKTHTWNEKHPVESKRWSSPCA